MPEEEPRQQIALVNRLASEDAGEPIRVHISYEIIRLFSEGLYQSPHKAIEELVSNGFDAGAKRVHILSPRTGDLESELQDSLWVIDDGTGMDRDGFKQLWRIAASSKADDSGPAGRKPIGQFGIGKLAAYVLAWRLTHISKTGGRYLYTSMDFHRVESLHQYEDEQKPLNIALHEIDEGEARALLAEVEERDSAAWSILFGKNSAKSWTAAALSDFKELFTKFRPGVLSWVLRTGLPLASDFHVFLDGHELESSKERITVLHEIRLGGEDEQATKLGLATTETGVLIPGIAGEIRGIARLYELPLSTGKALQYGRSHGFFIRVRGRVINLEDELFGIEALNHAAWSRFALQVDADGLRSHLLSSREGVRGSEPTLVLREYLRAVFNACRKFYETQRRKELLGLDIELLLKNASPSVLSDPLVAAVRQATQEARQPSHYITTPTDLDQDHLNEWFDQFETDVANQPFSRLVVEGVGPYDRLVEYESETRTLRINEDHPFIAKILAHSKNQTPATLFATSEVLTDAFIREAGFDASVASELFMLRDKALRQIAGDYGPDAGEVLRRLSIADQDKNALETAVGEAFIVLGFRYERRGQNRGGADGVLDAVLGLGEERLEDFRLVYDAKTTGGSSIAVTKADFGALWDFKVTERADFAFFVGKRFDGQGTPESALNRRTAQQRDKDSPMTVLTTDNLRRLVSLHYRFGVTMLQIRELFESAQTVDEVTAWIDRLETELTAEDGQVPLRRLLEGIEAAKTDVKSRPNIYAVRVLDEVLRRYEVPRLIAALQAVQAIVGQRWIEVNPTSGIVQMGTTASQIVIELERKLRDELHLTDHVMGSQ